MISTNVSSNQGRYVAYSQSIDGVLFSNLSKIKSFQKEKIEEILEQIKENNFSFNLGCGKGREMAIKELGNQVSSEIEALSQESCLALRKDIATSIVSSVLKRENV